MEHFSSYQASSAVGASPETLVLMDVYAAPASGSQSRGIPRVLQVKGWLHQELLQEATVTHESGKLCPDSEIFHRNRLQNMMYPTIPLPLKKSEFEWQAELWFLLKQKGYKVRGEVQSRSKAGVSRFDLVVYSGNQGACIIEVKDSPHEAVMRGKQTRQVRKYSEFGVPVIYYTPEIAVESVLAQVHAIIRGD